MKELLLHIALLVVWAGIASAQAPKFVASAAVTSTMPLSHVRVDSDPVDGLIYLYGSYEGAIYIQGDSLVSAGMSDGVIACFDERLRLLWWYTLGGPGMDRVEDIKVIPNQGVVVALSCGAGSATITTYTIGDITFTGRGNADVVSALFRREGGLAWARNEGADSYEIPSSVHQFTDGTLAIIGSFGSRSRFDTTMIQCGTGVSGGFVQMLTAAGEHLSITHTISIPNSGGSADPDGTVTFDAITNLTDSSITVVARGLGKNKIGDLTFNLGNGDPGTYLVALDRMGYIDSMIPQFQCASAQEYFEAENSSDGISVALIDCIYYPDFFIEWHDRPYGRRDMVLRTRYRNSEHAALASVTSIHRSGIRSLVFGGFVDTLDLPLTLETYDAIASSDTALPQAFVLIGDNVGLFRRVLHIPSTLRGDARWACTTAEGMAVIMSTTGTITLPDTSLPGTENGVVLMAFGEPLTGIGEWGMGNGEWGMENGEWGIGNGEWGMVWGVEGGRVYEGEVTRAVLGSLVPGVYVVQSGGRLSLCHVLSADNIAFAVPAAASRKGP